MSQSDLTNKLDKLLSEDMPSILKREASTLEEKIGSLDEPFLLFGAGRLGRKVVKKLASIGKQPAAFIDNNPALWGQTIEGLPIMSPAEAAQKFDPATTGVIVTIWFGEATDTMAERTAPIRALGFKKLALFGHLAWKFYDEFLPHFCLDLPSKVLESAANIRSAYSLLSDDASRRLFVDHIEWRLTLNYDVLPTPSDLEIYFNDHYVNYFESEVVYDIGAFTGDSIDSFLRSGRGERFSEIHSFEPSSGNFAALQEHVETLFVGSGKVFAHQLALGDTTGSISVEAENGPSSRVGFGNEVVPVTTIDLFSQTHATPSFIKMDIEGFEPQCLLGARQTITTTAPVVAASVYHLQSHLWEILLQLHSYYAGYSFSLCPHVADGWDLVLYAVPESRRPAA